MVVDIETIEVLAGKFPKKQLRLILVWAELHQKELIDDWHLLQSGEPAKPIKPLKEIIMKHGEIKIAAVKPL